METIVPIDIAKKLKDKGFDRICDYTYCNNYREKDEILELYPNLTDDGYLDLLKKNGGTLEEREVFGYYEEPLKIRSKNSLIEQIPCAICSAPRIYEVFHWFRIDKDIYISIIYASGNKYRWNIDALDKKKFSKSIENSTFEKCCFSAINKVLKTYL